MSASGDVWVVITGMVSPWHLEGRDHVCCHTSHGPHDSPHNRVTWPQVSVVPTCVLGLEVCVPPTSVCQTPNSHGDVWDSGALGR